VHVTLPLAMWAIWPLLSCVNLMSTTCGFDLHSRSTVSPSHISRAACAMARGTFDVSEMMSRSSLTQCKARDRLGEIGSSALASQNQLSSRLE